LKPLELKHILEEKGIALNNFKFTTRNEKTVERRRRNKPQDDAVLLAAALQGHRSSADADNVRGRYDGVKKQAQPVKKRK
jgi:hypothetical protein